MANNNTKTNKSYIMAVGRRKSAVARVRIYEGASAQIFNEERKKGDIVVNGKMIAEYFKFTSAAPTYKKILTDTNTEGKYIISAKIAGGGIASQLEAFIHGIARALDLLDKEKFHKLLSDKGYLTRDSRERERRKVGTGGKARRKKQSPKR